MNIIISVLVGFGVCSLMTFGFLVDKARNGLRPAIDKDGSVYWTKGTDAAIRACLDQMERTPKSAVSPDFIAAINNARKALGEQT